MFKIQCFSYGSKNKQKDTVCLVQEKAVLEGGKKKNKGGNFFFILMRNCPFLENRFWFYSGNEFCFSTFGDVGAEFITFCVWQKWAFLGACWGSGEGSRRGGRCICFHSLERQ